MWKISWYLTVDVLQFWITSIGPRVLNWASYYFKNLIWFASAHTPLAQMLQQLETNHQSALFPHLKQLPWALQLEREWETVCLCFQPLHALVSLLWTLETIVLLRLQLEGSVLLFVNQESEKHRGGLVAVVSSAFPLRFSTVLTKVRGAFSFP